MSEQTFRYLNKAVPRTEDYRLLTGYGRYLDDIEIAGALHVCFVRSPHAHARIVSVDTQSAAAMPGVVKVVTGRELAQWTTPMRVAPPVEGLLPVEFATMPVDIARFQGDLVACVVAADRYLAEDAAEQVMVEYEPLPAVTDMWQALDPDARPCQATSSRIRRIRMVTRKVRTGALSG
jgi:carbon-monoxide dehydrogenase large subunit